MMSLFNSFDLLIFDFQKFLFFTIIFIISFKTFKTSLMIYLKKEFFYFLINFFKSIKFNEYKYSYGMVCFLFMFIFFMNYFSLNSYIFSFTSQVSVVLVLSLMFWGSSVLMFLFNNPKHFILHMIPSGAPMILSFFLFAIEMVSNLIRFVTLMVRLVANILAGHLLIILLSKLVLMNFLISPAYIVLSVVELFVSLIQSYIFCTMICLYLSDVN